MLFRDGHSLEVVPNLCFVTLMDVSISIYVNFYIDLSLCKHKLVFHGLNIMA